MRYFELKDDMLIPERWHLGDVTTKDGEEPRLRAGIPFARAGDRLKLGIGRPGRALDYSLTSFAVPICRSVLAGAIAATAERDLQRIDVDVPGHSGLVVLNAVRVIKCLDEGRSEFLKWTAGDYRTDLAGDYRMVTNLRIRSDQVPADAHFFRVEGWLIALIVSEKVKDAMESAGCLGAKFVEVT